MRPKMRTGLWLLVATFITSGAVAGCGDDLSPSSGPPDALGRPVPDAYVPDAAESSPYWVMIAVAHNGNMVAAHPFGGTHFAAPCEEYATGYLGSLRDLFVHPTQPTVYGVETGFHSLSTRCTGITATGASNAFNPRLIQQIAFDATTSVGFFTADGVGALGVYRFTAAADGTPTLAESANAPSIGSPLVLDAAGARLYVGGAGILAAYTLSGPALALPVLPDTYTSAGGCQVPVRLLRTASYVLELCGDIPTIRRYQVEPFGFDADAGTLGAVAQAVALPGDRAVVARVSPPDLAIVDLHAGTPTVTAGPALGSAATAMAVSRDGTVVATARTVDATTSELALWRVAKSTVTLIDTQQVAGTVTAVALTAPGT